MDLTLNLTSACNMDCLYCYAKSYKYSQEMTLETATKAISIAMENSHNMPVKITFVGGEPLLKKELIKEIVYYCNEMVEQVFLFSILTNGTLLGDEFFEFSLKNKIAISLSFDGIREAHDLFRKINNNSSWDIINEKFQTLMEKSPDSMILITLNPQTIKYLCESVKYLVNNGAANLSVSLNYQADWDESHLSELFEQLYEIAQFYTDKFLQNESFYLSLFDSRIFTLVNGNTIKGRCENNLNHISVDPDGDFFPCIAFTHPNSVYKIGNVKSGVNWDKFKAYMMESSGSNDLCMSCEIKDRCFNWCRCVRYLAKSSIKEIPPLMCGFEKMLIPICDKIAERLYKEDSKKFVTYFHKP